MSTVYHKVGSEFALLVVDNTDPLMGIRMLLIFEVSLKCSLVSSLSTQFLCFDMHLKIEHTSLITHKAKSNVHRYTNSNQQHVELLMSGAIPRDERTSE